MSGPFKHAPATPLPWVADGHHVTNADPKTRMYIVVKREGPQQNAAYIAHAANAYPKLVEFVRTVAADRDAEDARALLRELGEDA